MSLIQVSPVVTSSDFVDHFESHGVPFAVRTNCRDLRESLSDFLPPRRSKGAAVPHARTYTLISPKPDDIGAQTYRLYVGKKLKVNSSDPFDLFDHIEGDLQIHVGEMAREFAFIHSGVIAWKGRGVLIPGRSCWGKSTLVQALIRAGATYYSDEYAILDRDGGLHAYPRRLSLRIAGQARAARRTAESLGAKCGTDCIRPALVLLTRYQAGAEWSPQPIAAGSAIQELIRHSLSIRRQAEFVLDVLENLVAEARVVQTKRGDADETAQHILNLVSAV